MMKQKLLTLFLALAASVAPLFAQSGTCGTNLKWTLYDGILTISGTGAMTDYASSYAVPWYSYRESIKTVIIEDGVTSIGEDAFSRCSSLTSVTIPNSVTSIGNFAFDGCSSLTSITIPNSVTSIGFCAFQDCSGLTSITIPNSVTSIGYYAFNGCHSLTAVHISDIAAWCKIGFGGYEAYAHNLYLNGTLVTDLVIPNSVTSIGDYAFSGCSSLTSVTIPNSVTSIGYDAFKRCINLTSITIPNSVTSIGEGAFAVCSSLTSITIPSSVTSIGYDAFAGCSSLTSVTIPNSVTSIGWNTFSGCSSLTSITIPNSVTSIGYEAFENCSSLISVTIPNSVTSVGYDAFYNCSSLPVINNLRYADTYLVEAVDNTLSIYTIKEGTRWIGDYAFDGCSSLTSITIPNSVTSIGENAFRNCKISKLYFSGSMEEWCTKSFSPNSISSSYTLYINGEAVTNAVIPNSVTSIGYDAFNGCRSLKSVTMESATPPTIGSSAFDSTTPIYVPLGAWNAYQKDDNWKIYNLRLFDTTIKTSAVSPTSAAITFSASLKGEDKNKYIAACGMEEGEEFSGNTAEYIGLEPESEYADVPFYIRTTKEDILTIPLTFKTSALTLTTLASKAVSNTTSILLAETNMSDAETSCGFEWRRNDQPADMPSNQVLCPVANGLMAGRLKGLKDDVYYKYRAFYKSAAGNYYYGDWQYIFTGDVTVEFDPVLYTYAAQFVSERKATLKGYALAGSDDFTEQGFEYWAESRRTDAPARRAPQYAIGEKHTVKGTGISMRVTLEDLDEGTVYKYRTYAKVGGKTLYGAEMTFTTQGTYEDPIETDLDLIPDADAYEDSLTPIPPTSQARKYIRNGILYIEHNGITYTAQGHRLY